MAFDWIDDLSTIVDKAREKLCEGETKQNASAFGTSAPSGATIGKKKEMSVDELQAAINAEKAAGGGSTASAPNSNTSFEDVLKGFNPDDLKFEKEDDTIPEGTTDSELMKMLYKNCLVRRVRDLERSSGGSAPSSSGDLMDIKSTLSDIKNTVDTINSTVDGIDRTADYLYQHCD